MNITVDGGGKYLQNGAGPPPNPDLSLASFAFYSSFQNPVSTANDPINNFDFLKGVVTNWNSYNPDLVTPIYSIAAANNDDIGGSNTFTTAAGFDYVVFHFGGGQAGDGGAKTGGEYNPESGWWSAWYLGGESHNFTLPQEGDPLQPVGGFSSARYFNGTPTNAPDGGATMALLAVSLLGLGGVRCFLPSLKN
jgi:hypothetical protein